MRSVITAHRHEVQRRARHRLQLDERLGRSQFLGLQLKARFEGPGTPVHRLQEVNHTG
jgi:hypothetical protein